MFYVQDSLQGLLDLKKMLRVKNKQKGKSMNTIYLYKKRENSSN